MTREVELNGSGRVPLLAALITALVICQWLVIDPRWQDALAVMGGTRFYQFRKPPPANDFPMASLDGRVFTLSDLKGRVVLLNFWRKNCPFCIREKGHLERLVRSLNRPDLEVLCVNLWDNPSWIRKRYARKAGGNLFYATKSDNRRWVMENRVRGRLMGYYVVNDANEAIYEVKGFPTTYVIDKNGRVVATHTGMVDWTNPAVRDWLLNILGPRPAMIDAGPVDYQLPKWLDRLLANNLSQARTTLVHPTRLVRPTSHHRIHALEQKSGPTAKPFRR